LRQKVLLRRAVFLSVVCESFKEQVVKMEHIKKAYLSGRRLKRLQHSEIKLYEQQLLFSVSNNIAREESGRMDTLKLRSSLRDLDLELKKFFKEEVTSRKAVHDRIKELSNELDDIQDSLLDCSEEFITLLSKK
jgi:hypothetical protein